MWFKFVRFFYTESRKAIPGEKKKNNGKQLWAFSSLIFLCSQGQSCASTYLAEQRILNVENFKLVGTICSALVLRVMTTYSITLGFIANICVEPFMGQGVDYLMLTYDLEGKIIVHGFKFDFQMNKINRIKLISCLPVCLSLSFTKSFLGKPYTPTKHIINMLYRDR